MKVLIIDDEAVSRKKLERFAQNLGYETSVAEDGNEGWNLWYLERPKIVITDWIMPKMQGPELCRKIRENEGCQYTYLIIVSSKEGREDLMEGMEAGADDYITKPVTKAELAIRIKAGERVLSLQSKDLVIFAMAKLAESRDPDTGYHLERISDYSRALAEIILESKDCPVGLNTRFVENLAMTSPLHDIGKVGVPDRLLVPPA